MAILAGLLLSVTLFLFSYVTDSQLWYWPQAIGFYLTMLLRGVHLASAFDFVTMSVPTNALIYALVIFGFRSPRRLTKDSGLNAIQPNSPNSAQPRSSEAGVL
jgi:hypothetical protein